MFDCLQGGFKVIEKDAAGKETVVEYTYKDKWNGSTLTMLHMKGDKVAYKTAEFRQMETTPATKIPSIGPKMERIALVAEPRRIAVKYDQITAFQAKTDYGFSLDKQIAEQACGELAYEIDTEIVDALCC